MPDLEHAVMMLRLAESDLKALRNMGDTDCFDDAIWGFHAQQSVEKLLKAWLSLLGESYPRTHDLRVLMRQLETVGVSGIDRHLGLVDLADYAVQFRYELGADAEALERARTSGEIEALEVVVKELFDQCRTNFHG